MAPQVVLDSDVATLKYHPDTHIVHHEFRAFVRGEKFRDVLWQGLELMKKHGGSKWLSDDRGNAALTSEDTEWAQSIWFPAVKAAGWKHWAVVMPTKVLGQLNMKQWIAQYAALGINSQIFDDPDKAYAWLAAQK